MRYITRPQFVEAVQVQKTNQSELQEFTDNQLKDFGVADVTQEAFAYLNGGLILENEWLVKADDGSIVCMSDVEFNYHYAKAE